MNIADVLIVCGFVLFLFILLCLVIIVTYMYILDRKQVEHPVLRNYPLLGKVRYFLEKLGPELRQYLYNSDLEGKPFSRYDYEHVVKSSKYMRDVLGFGSLRDFEKEGYFVQNAMFSKQMEELKMDFKTKIDTHKYLLIRDGLFTRKERWEKEETPAYLLHPQDAVIIGESTPNPFVLKGLIGMSAMSYGALGSHAITALSEGLGLAGGTWMNTGEGGLSPYHLKGNVDIIMQIGPGLFGVRDESGQFDWDELKRKSDIPQIKAFEIKLAQGAKTRGGHIDGEKVTPEIAAIRKVEPYQSIDSPNRFYQFHDAPSLFEWIEKIREHTGKPVGIKLVVGSKKSVIELAAYMKQSGKGPDFITVDGGEGGTGATYQELADSAGLPIKSALMIVNATLQKYKVRDRVKLIASGKLFTPDRIAIALGMGADLVNIARGFMISIGCIQALKCHSNACPVGVATTDPDLQKALVINEKKYRVANYLISLRKGLFRMTASSGLESPVQFSQEHIMFKDQSGYIRSLEEIYSLFSTFLENEL